MSTSRVDAVVVGAGFTGIYALYRLREMGLTAQVFERGDGVGGTWFWNQYPGARCDVESIDYQYSFSQELVTGWQWTERYPAADEIVRYLNHVVDTFGLRDGIKLNTTVTSAVYDEAAKTWTVKTDAGDEVIATFLIFGTGCLSVPQEPKFKGLEKFTGEWFHTGAWPKTEPSYAGKRVAVVGTGSSGVQVIPVVAEKAAELTVFQRTANYVMPAFNRSYGEGEYADMAANFPERRRKTELSITGLPYDETGKAIAEIPHEEAIAILDERWTMGGLPMYAAFTDVIFNPESNKVPAEYFAAKIREVIKDEKLADMLTPKGYAFATKRLCVGTNYYETFLRDNVDLVSIADNPIAEITENGIKLEDGSEYEFDMIIFATGYDAMTGALNKIDIRGADGHVLKEEWKNGPVAYLGVAVAGYPNMFLVTGPGSPSVFSNMVVSIEQHVDWIADAIKNMRDKDAAAIQVAPEAQDAWVAHVNEVANMTLHVKTNSWYMGANIPGKPRVFMGYLGGVGPFRAKCDEVAANDYEGFELVDA